MNTAEALKFAEEMKSKISYRLECAATVPARSYYEKQDEMLTCAIAAMRDRQERENPKPLTLDELRGMVGEWVWVVVSYEHDGTPFQCEGWAFVSTPAVVAYLEQIIPIDFYGHKFIAYRHQPDTQTNTTP